MSDENESPWMSTFSVPVVPRGERYVMLSGLAEKHKREAWAVISKTNPALAHLLKDPNLKEIMRLFDADLLVDASVVPALPSEPLKGRKRAGD
ncbi:hypothetical protein [Pseudomonas mosselii]|uniref:hypothetical protein n=1 Tax=Pseudomonas mosselii TaxID=78327 RepID=UPI0021D9A96F|nr:hypothetical protein [Pseudomonas mosselii]MCU9528505.1 hypothetical protein [Pseudomonas mosselii]MCU9535839.1 hypothetical protein [Pseudomonas mosselii]MCU9542897.1 hypothetical protein [Pseudomonas mosselii]MCU9548778.1 hypothetical protein [Pseudomonas mosselii]